MKMSEVQKARPITLAYENVLVCPVCGDEYLHHRTETDCYSDSIFIEFDCEQGCTVTLEIRQHKGMTFMEWVVMEEYKGDPALTDVASIQGAQEWPGQAEMDETFDCPSWLK